MIIMPNLDNYCLYTYCGGVAFRQDRHTPPFLPGADDEPSVALHGDDVVPIHPFNGEAITVSSSGLFGRPLGDQTNGR